MDCDEGPPLNPPDASQTPGGGGEQDHDGSQPAPSLPDDVLADIFGRLAPRWIAASRCVCPSWRASIDGRRLLRADLLPLSLRGIFTHFDLQKYPAFFSRPTPPSAPAFSGKLSFLPSADPAGCVWYPDEPYDIREKYSITDHCNGLLLIDKYVVNPATRRWDALPPAPPGRVQFIFRTDQDLGDGTPHYETIHNYLVFDPTVSPHYQVLRICALSRMHDLRKKDTECPSPVCTLNVLSSRSGCWEERRFVREGDAAGTFLEVRARALSTGEEHFMFTVNLISISLSTNTYRVIRPPPDYEADTYPGLHPQKSEKGVYFVSLDKYWLRVWILVESCGQIEWVLKHDKDLEPVLARRRPQQVHGPWMLKGINHNSFCTCFPEDYKEDIVEEKIEWSSDTDDVLDDEDMIQKCSSKECHSNNESDDILGNKDTIEECSSEANKKAVLEEKFESSSKDDDIVEDCYFNEEDRCVIAMLGFHPYKEILFLSESAKTGLAYHLNSSKIQCLGNIYPTDYANYCGYRYEGDEMDTVKYAFPYTPCWIEEFPRKI
uniref:Uncharacterized protein n=1 Tax=Avena sativa TaxID=4498 RepID=A0ACD5VMJ7_AVESA